MDFTKLISEAQCHYILEQKFGSAHKSKLLKHTLSSLSDNVEGFMGEHLRLKCEILLENKKEIVQFFIKKQVILTDDIPLDLIEAFNETLAYKKEAFFYKILDADSRKLSCIARHYPFPQDTSLLVLDDLSVDQFVLGKDALFDLDHCKVVLENLAKLHSYSLSLAHKYDFTKVPELLDDTFFSYHNKFAANYMRASMETTKMAMDCHPFLDKNVKVIFEREVERILTEIVRPSKRFPNVFCHGDLWHNNILFKYNDDHLAPTQCCFVDFQELRYLPPVHDVQFLLYINTTPEFRQKHLHDLFEYYYVEFAKQLHNLGFNSNLILPWCDFLESAAEFYPFTKFIAAIYQLCHLTGDEFLTKTFKLKPDSVNLYLGARHQYLIPELQTNAEYRAKYMEVLDEFIEVLLNRHVIREDCFEIVRRTLQSDNYTLTGFKVHSNRLKIQVLQNGATSELKFFFKSLNGDLNKKEVFVYQVLALNNTLRNSAVEKLIRKVMPECYYAVNTKSIVLEDLEGQGFKKTGAEQLDYKTVDMVIQTLAKLHAAYWILEHKSASKRIHKYYEISDVRTELSKEVIYTNPKAVSSVYDAILATANEFFPDLNLTDIKYSETKFLHSLKPSETHKNVLCHGSLTLEHILFKYCKSDRSPIECRFVDFKESRYLPPAYDLLVFLFSSTSQQFRDEYFDQIFKSYYSYLVEELKAVHLNIHDFLTFEDLTVSRFHEVREIALIHVLNKLVIKEKQALIETNKNKIIEIIALFD